METNLFVQIINLYKITRHKTKTTSAHHDGYDARFDQGSMHKTICSNCSQPCMQLIATILNGVNSVTTFECAATYIMKHNNAHAAADNDCSGTI